MIYVVVVVVVVIVVVIFVVAAVSFNVLPSIVSFCFAISSYIYPFHCPSSLFHNFCLFLLSYPAPSLPGIKQ